MENRKTEKQSFEINLRKPPIALADIETSQRILRSAHRSHINFVLALVVLACGVSYRAASLDYAVIRELVEISVHVGFWFGLFSAVMSDSGGKRKLQMIFVGIFVASAAGMFACVLTMLFIGKATAWITAMCILGSSLACMWLLTYYDETIKHMDAFNIVNKNQLDFIDKAAANFDEPAAFVKKIQQQGRLPLMAEYWAMREWIKQKARQADKPK